MPMPAAVTSSSTSRAAWSGTGAPERAAGVATGSVKSPHRFTSGLGHKALGLPCLEEVNHLVGAERLREKVPLS